MDEDSAASVTKMASPIEEEELLKIPSYLLKSKTGFSVDFGGSCIKIVYAVTGTENETADVDDTVLIRMISFPSEQLDVAMTFLKSHLSAGVIGKGQQVFTTGVGSHINQKFIESFLGIRIENLSEMDCFVDAFRFLLRHFSLDEIVHPHSDVDEVYKNRLLSQVQAMLVQQLAALKLQDQPQAAKAAAEVGQHVVEENTDSTLVKKEILGERASDGREQSKGEALCSEIKQKTDYQVAPGTAAVDDVIPKTNATKKEQFPCMLAMIGSGGGIIKVENDKYMVLDGMTRCGRMFLGLGSLLVGCKSFDELVDLASKGNHETLTVLAKHLKSAETSDIYSQMPDDLVLYCFGHGVGHHQDEFKKEDLAAALLTTIAQDLAQCSHLNSIVLNTSHVFFFGSFVGRSQLVRDIIGGYFNLRSALDNMFNQHRQKIVHHFLKYGGYLGALGCLLLNMNRSCGE